MNEELLRQALQSGQITPAQFEEFMRNMQGLLGGQQAPATEVQEFQPPTMPPQRTVNPMIGEQMPQVGNRGLDTPQERDFLQNIMQDYNKRY